MLCLYHPRDFKWHQSHDLMRTVILWSMLWIEFFEIFSETGKWYGPEAKHDNTPPTPKLTNENIEKSNNKIKNKNSKKSEPKYLKNFPTRLLSHDNK